MNTNIYLILYELYNYIYEIWILYSEHAIVDEIREQVRYIFDNGCTCLWMVDSLYGVSVLYLSCMRTANAIC